MPIVQDEQQEKKQSVFLEVENGSKVWLQSKLYKLNTYYVPSIKKSIWGEDVVVEAENENARRTAEYIYWGKVDNEEGLIRLKPSVFFGINETEKMLGVDKRNMIFIIGKTGSGMNTRYSVTREKDVSISEEEIKAATDKLLKAMEEYEKQLKRNLNEYLKKDTSDVSDLLGIDIGSELPF